MSEYQYYEFQAIDRPLDENARDHLRSISSRAEITSTSLINEYHYGNFKGDPVQLMTRYFDAHLYLANWGSRRLMLRLPLDAFVPEASKGFETEDSLEVLTTKSHVILDMNINPEDGGEYLEEGNGWLAGLISLRTDLVAGDLRCLYLAWLAGVQNGQVDEDTLEPPVPPGLKKLSASVKRFADFFCVDSALIKVAATVSGDEVRTAPSVEKIAEWVAALPEADKNNLLMRLIHGEGAFLGGEMLQRFHKDNRHGQGQRHKAESASPTRRTAGKLVKEMEEQQNKDRQQAQAKAARVIAQKERERVAAREAHLDSLVGGESQLWKQVQAAIKTTKPTEYDRAVQLLQDLRDLAKRGGTSEAFSAQVRQFREQHRNKPSLLRRLGKAGLA